MTTLKHIGRAGRRGIANGVLALGLAGVASAATVTTRVDYGLTSPAVDGVIGANEYGNANANNYSGGGTGFGGVLNGSNRILMKSDASNLYIAFTPGASLNDFAVMYLDTKPGGFTDAGMNDSGDTGRTVVTNLGSFGDDGFPFAADYAILMHGGGCTLFELTGGSLNVLPLTSANCASGNNTTPREMRIALSDIAAGGGNRPIDFFVAYCSGSQFNSNETVPPIAAINGAANPGTAATVTYFDSNRFVTASPVVISQIWTTAPSSGTVPNADYVELFNTGSTAVDLTTYSLQYAASAGTSWTRLGLTGVVPARSYFLVRMQNPSSTGTSNPLPLPDQTAATIDMAGVAGKIALYNGAASAATGTNGTPPAGAFLIDFIGYGGTTDAREAGGPPGSPVGTTANNAAPPSGTLALFRTGCGASDTNLNSSDFATGTPNPRNSLVSSNGLTGSGSNITAATGATPTITVTGLLCGGGAVSGLATATIDLSSLGGSATQSMGAPIAGVFTLNSFMIPASANAGSYSLVATITDGSSSGNALVVLNVTSATANANDACGANQAAYTIPGSGGTATGSVVNATLDAGSTSCSGAGADVYHYFTPSVTGSYDIRICPSNWNWDGTVSIHSGCPATTGNTLTGATFCANGGCPGTSSTLLSGLSNLPLNAGTMYVIRVAAASATTPSVASYNLRVSPAFAPNDICTGATSITITSGQGSATGNNTFAVAGLDPFNVSMCTTAGKDLWYSFSTGVSGAGNWIISTCTGTTQDTVLDVFAACGDAAPLACNDDTSGCGTGTQSSVTVALAANSTYRIRVASKGVSPTGGPFTLSILSASPPSNDVCASASAIAAAGGSATGILQFALLDGPASACSTTVDKDMWYSFSPTTASGWRFSTCGSAADTVLELWSACGGTVLACNDDSGGACGTASQFDVPNLAAGTYLLRVAHKAGGADGTISVLIAATPPDNDVCAGAVALLVNAPVAGRTTGATADYNFSGASALFPGINQTASAAPGRDAVFTFTAPESTNYSLRVSGYSVGNLLLWAVNTCPAPGTIPDGDVIRASNRTATAEELFCLPLSAGQQIWLIVDDTTAGNAGSTFTVEVTKCVSETEPNDSPAQANVYMFGSSGMSGTIEASGAADFYSIGAPPVGYRVFAMTDGLASANTDTLLRVTTSADTLEYDDDDGDVAFGSASSVVAGTPLTGVASFIRVNAFSTNIIQPYRLYAVVQPDAASAAAESEPNDALGQAGSAASNYFSGSLASTSDIDLYSFTASAGQVVYLGLDCAPARGVPAINAQLGLLDNSGNVLIAVDGTTGTANNVTSGTGSLTATNPSSNGEGLVWRIRTSGTYFARVTTATTTNLPGGYLLSVAVQPDITIGACCVGTSCTLIDNLNCGQVGVFLGTGTTCTPNPCTPPGACCAPGGGCTFVTVAACITGGAYFIGEGVACSPTVCPTGACCLTSGTCVVNIQLDCTAQSGTSWTAAGTCTPNLCVGRCCLNDGTCTVTTPANCAGSYGGGGTTCAGAPSNSPQTFTASAPDVPLLIPDNTAAGVNSTITVAPSFVVGKATVFVSIPAHTFIGDLVVKLTKGTTTVTLFSRACSGTDGLTATFDDAGSTTQICTFPQGTIRPATFAGGSLANFNGLSSDGVWTLNVSDNAGTDTGTLVAWSLILDPAISPCQGACCVAGTCQQLSVDACAAASGSYKGAGTLCSAQPIPSNPTGAAVDQPSYCASAVPATISLTAACAGGDTIQWFTGSCGGTPIGTGSPLVISAPITSTTYFARCLSECGPASACVSVDVTVMPVATPPTGAGADITSYCSNTAPATISLSASGGSGLTLNWYAGSCGGASIGTGSPLVIPAPAATTTYHAQWSTPCGASTCASVTVTVTPAPTVDAGVAADTCAPATVALSGSGSDAAGYLWTGGAGSFADATSPVTTYTPGPTETGSVTLTLTATGNTPCAAASDTVTFNVGQPPTAVAGPSLAVTGCTAFPVALSGSVSNAASSLWTTSGTGTFADATSPVTTYTVSPADVTAGTVTLTLTANPSAPCTVAASSVLTLTVLPPLTTAVVDDDYIGLPNGAEVTYPAVGGTGSYIIGCNAFGSIQAALAAVTGSTVNVAPGTYDEDLSIVVDNTNLVGSGAAVTIIRGVPDTHPNNIGSATVQVIGRSGVTISGLTITRLGNSAATWNDPLNNNGLLASSSPGLTVRDCIITGNRNGVNMQFMTGATVRNNVIDFNRTGMQCVDNVTNSTFTQNTITNNWTIGVLFRDETAGGSDTSGTVFSNNNISGNWYAQIEYRNPDNDPVTLKNFSGNWLGTTTPTQQPSNGGEPGYAAQIPVEFGGTAVPPGPMGMFVADVKGDAIANFDITPMLTLGTDTDVSTGFGTFGFQGNFASLSVTATLNQAGAAGRVQEGVDEATSGGTVSVQAGTYAELVRITQPVSLLGAQAGVCAQGGAARGAESVLRPPATASALIDVLVYLDASGVTIDGFTLDGDNLAAGGQASGGEFADVGNLISNSSFEDDVAYPFVHVKNVSIENNILRNVNDVAVQLWNDGADPVSDGNTIACNDFNNIGGDNVIGTGGPYNRIGVLIYNDTYAQIDDNSLRGCNIGVQTGNNFRGNGGPAAGMNDNQLSMVENVGLWHNLHYASASPWTISGNTVAGLSGANSAGIFVTSLYNSATATVSNNIVSGFGVGLEFWNNPVVPAVSVSGGSVTGCDNGVRLYNNWAGGYGDGEATSLALVNVALTNNDAGLVIADTPGDDPGAPVRGVLTVDASGLTATGSTGDGVTVSGGRARLFLHDSLSSVTGNAVGVSVSAGVARIQTTNLTGNSAAGLAVTSGGVADLGQCAPGGDVTGLGLSTGGNDLSGYGFDAAAPHAIVNGNSSSESDVFAAGNNFGAGAGDNINLAVSGNGGANSDILYDQPGNPLFATQPAGGSACVGGSFMFTALAYNITGYQWYKDAALLGGETGPTLTINPVTLASAGSYTVEITDLCGNTTTSAPAVLAVNPQPVAPSGAGVDSTGYCASAAPATITLTASGGSGDTLEWFSGSCGGTPVGTGSPLVITAPTTTTTYFARWTNTCGSSACASVMVDVTPDPAAPTLAAADTPAFCADSAPANISLSASGGSGDTLEWFSGSCGGTPIGTGNPLVIAAPTSTTTYFARWTSTCGSSTCASVTVTVQAAPTATAGGPYTVTGQTPVPISGTASNQASVLWTSSGTGTFANAAALSTTYTPSAADETAGTVTLTLTANPTAPCATAASANALLTITACATGTVVYVDDGYVGLPFGTAVNFPHDGMPGPHLIGCNAFATIQGAVNAVVAPGTVNVAAGAYNEDVTIGKTVSILGAGPGGSVLSGPIGGPGAGFTFAAEGIVLAGFTITRDGNNTTDWNNPALNSAGVAIQSRTSGTVRDCLITGNRTGIDINNSSNITVRNSVIDFNRTGLILRNTTDNLTVAENAITNNWTVGLLFLDASGGSNAPLQQALGSDFGNNNFSGNWYGQIVDRQSGGSLPVPGTTNLKNFSGNWLGTTTPVISTANSAEPGYAAQIPVAFGGTAVSPGGQPDVLGPASDNFDITPMLSLGTDTDVSTGFGVYGFQGDYAALVVTGQLAQTGSTGRVQEGHDEVSTGGDVAVGAGTFTENVVITKHLTLDGAGSGDCASGGDPLTQTVLAAANAALPTVAISDVGGASAMDRLTLRDLRITGSTAAGVQASSTAVRSFYLFDNVAVAGNGGTGLEFVGTSGFSDVEVTGSSFCGNYVGIRTATSLASFDGLVVDGCEVRNSAFNGLAMHGSTASGFNPTNITISNSQFASNGQSSNLFQGSGDLSFFEFNGNATITNVTVATTGRVPVQFRGRGLASPGTWLPAGTVTINGLTIAGSADRPAMYIHFYNSVTGFTLNNVDLTGVTSAAPPNTAFSVSGMILDHTGAAPLQLGNTAFPCPGGGYAALAVYNTGGARATCSTTFAGATTLAQKEACVVDADDPFGLPGQVTFDDVLIASPPVGGSVCAGGMFTFTVSASGLGPISYQWRRDGNPVGTDSSSYSIASATLADSGSYTVDVTNACGTVTTTPVSLSVFANPVAPSAAAASSTSYCLGDVASITLTASGGSGETLQWFDDSCGGTIIGTGSPLVIAAPASTTTYHARWLTTNCGASTCASVTVTVNTVPGSPTLANASPNQLCDGGNVTLTASVTGANVTVDWYAGSCGGTPVGSGTMLVVPVTSTTTYFARARNTLTGCESAACDSTTVTVLPSPVAPSSASVSDPSFCAGIVATITLTAAGGSGDTLRWYKDSCGGVAVGTGSPLVIAAPTASATYHARWESVSCGDSACASVAVNVQAAPTVSAGGPYLICENGVAALSGVSSNAASVLWTSSGTGSFSNPASAMAVYTPSGADISAGSVTLTLTAQAIAPCTGSVSSMASLTIQPLPVAPTSASVNTNNFCEGSVATVTLTAAGGSGAKLTWHKDSCGGTLVGNGTPLVIPAPSVTTTYFARWINPCGTSSCASVTVTVYPNPVAPSSVTVSQNTWCDGSGPANITLMAVGGSGDTFEWFTGSCGSAAIGTGVSLVVPAPASTTTYFGRWTTANCGSSACASVSVTVNPLPTAPTSASVDAPAYCEDSEPASITLTAAGGSGDTLRWYSGSCGGTAVGTGSPLVIAAPLTTTTYFARWETTACGASACASVSVTVNPLPTAPTGITSSHDNFCSTSVANITLTAVGGSGDTLEWFDDSCGGNLIGTGSPLVIAAPLTTTTYHARWTNGCGDSSCASLSVTVTPIVGACCSGYGVGKNCNVVPPASCAPTVTPAGAYRGDCTTCTPTACCPADYNNNGIVSVQDIFDYLAAYFAGSFEADFNNNTFISVQDIFDYLAAYFSGC